MNRMFVVRPTLCTLFLLLLISTLRADVHVVIDKPAMQLTVFDDSLTIATFPIACGKNLGQKRKRGDNRTPEGTFTITQIQDAHSWNHDFGDGKGVIKGAYGPWFLRLSYGSGIGIHGTHDPASMGHRASEGCIRLKNEDISRLHDLVQVGTKVQILADLLPAKAEPKTKKTVPKPELAEAARQKESVPSAEAARQEEMAPQAEAYVPQERIAMAEVRRLPEMSWPEMRFASDCWELDRKIRKELLQNFYHLRMNHTVHPV